MSSLGLVVPSLGSMDALQRRFLDLLPRLEAHGRVFRTAGAFASSGRAAV
jgi:hypothetical protein